MKDGMKVLIAEDEPPQRRALRAMLEELWPQAQIVAECGDGVEAQAAIERERPEALFLDLRMPGAGGLEVAEYAAEEAQERRSPAPLVVFVTAYDDAAIAAFDRGAVDYVLKPVRRERLALAIERLRQRGQAPMAELLQTLRRELAPPPAPASKPLQWVTATVRDTVRLYAIEDILAFQAQDKYTRALTANDEALLRTSLRELAQSLDPEVFWQVHRSAIVRATAIEKITRDELGKSWLTLKGRGEVLPVASAFHSKLRSL
jgi:DNA-binding LytR/AlgR family response regulator